MGEESNPTAFPTTMRRVLILDADVPYGAFVSGWLQVHSVTLERLVEQSRQFERSYLAWETVRKVRNPYFEDGTGFEGYFVGRLGSPGEALEMLLKIGQEMIENNRRLYPYNPLFRSRLMRTLRGELEDPDCIEVWAAQFGAVLGRLRCNLLTNQKASLFQAETYLLTNRLPPITYERRKLTIQERYRLPFGMTDHGIKWSLRHELMQTSKQDAGLVATSVGKFGHPLIRAYLNERFRMFGS